MKKTILKTVAITVAVLVAVTCLLYVCLMIFSPVTLGKLWDGLGSYDLSVKYYEKQYDKTGDINDLSAFTVKLDEKGDAERTAKYLSVMVDREDFNSFCTKSDDNSGYGFSARDYYYGKYTVATFYFGGLDSALNVAEKCVNEKYSAHSPFYVLMAEAEELKKADADRIAVKIGEIILTGRLSAEELINANSDISFAYKLKG